MKTESKYLLAALLALALLAVPSLMLWDAVKSHFAFVDSLSANISAGRQKPLPSAHAPRGRLVFVPFSVKAPKAEKVGIAADFNGWDASRFQLLKGKDGVWRTEIPLPPGHYCYQFSIDGKTGPNPAGGQTAEIEGKKCSVLTVK